MRNIFSDEKNYGFKAEITGLPRRMNITDIDVVFRGKEDMVAAELKHIKEMPEEMPVNIAQYYTYKFLSRRGIPAFYLFKMDSGATWVLYVDRHKEHPTKGGMLMLPKKEMGRHASLQEVTDLLAALIECQESHKPTELANTLGKLTKQKFPLEALL